jgi:alkaline phosphatase
MHPIRILTLAGLVLALCAQNALAAEITTQASPRIEQAKNIIFMVPDGMGLSYVTAARIFLGGVNGAPLEFETLNHIGYQRTHSLNSVVTDSAAAASAWACGEKFVNNEISFHEAEGTAPETILDIARDLGKATGLVATSTITHATPGAFGAHVKTRKCEKEIARQYIEETKVDVLLGGGVSTFRSTTADQCGTSGDFIAAAQDAGYRVALKPWQLPANYNANPPKKLLGLFAQDGLTPEYQRDATTDEPHLSEMTWWALRSLETDPDGFFLMVEGSQIDWAGHANDQDYLLGEMVAFNDAVGVVKLWLETHPTEAARTLVIVVADHETGGYAVNGPYDEQLLDSGSTVEAGWTHDDHTDEDTIIWSQGPCSDMLAKAVDNTYLFSVMKTALGVE